MGPGDRGSWAFSALTCEPPHGIDVTIMLDGRGAVKRVAYGVIGGALDHAGFPALAYALDVYRFWSVVFRQMYAVVARLGPLVHAWLLRFSLGNVVELVVIGRRTGRPYHVPLGLLRHHGAWYLGHPNGRTSWTVNLDAAGGVAALVRPHATPVRVRATLLPDGPERDATVAATWRQHIFPGNVVYWLARRHVAAAGRYYRLGVLDAPDGTLQEGVPRARGTARRRSRHGAYPSKSPTGGAHGATTQI